MKVVYALQPLQKSIMLLGPTPRDERIATWRPEAIQILKDLNFDGTVFVPESDDWAAHDHYDAQIHWEWEALEQATVCAFWVPRDLDTMPAFTTNVEFGLSAKSGGRTLLGYPPGSPKMAYLKALAERYHIPVYLDLHDLMWAASERANALFHRSLAPSSA